MTTLSAPVAPPAAEVSPTRLPLWRTILFRTGLVITTIMAIFNTVNGGGALLGLAPGVESSVLIGALLFGIGLPTLLLVGTAWIPRQWALITVIVLRFLEAATMWVPFGPGDWYSAPDRQGFYLTLVAASLVVCALASFGLRRPRR